MTVSIGLPVYNGERHLRQAIDTLLAQDYSDIELIISDNASTDGTRDICRMYKDKRINYYRNKTNIGAPANFNLSFWLSHGEYFMWAAADDYREPNYVSSCLKAFQGNIVLVGTYCDCLDEEGNLMLIDRSLSTVGLNTTQRFKKYKRILHEPHKHRGGIVYGVYKREALVKVMPFKKDMTADHNMMLQLCLLGEFETVPEILLTRRMSGASNSRNSLQRLAQSYGITNPLVIYGAYVSREYEIARMIRNSDLSVSEKAKLTRWSLLHTFTAVSSRLWELRK